MQGGGDKGAKAKLNLLIVRPSSLGTPEPQGLCQLPEIFCRLLALGSRLKPGSCWKSRDGL